jgi:hypothetical protein
MTTLRKQPDPSAQTGSAGTSLQTEAVKATVAEIKADNAALKVADEAAEAQAEVVVEQAQQLASAVEEVAEELREIQAGSAPMTGHKPRYSA